MPRGLSTGTPAARLAPGPEPRWEEVLADMGGWSSVFCTRGNLWVVVAGMEEEYGGAGVGLLGIQRDGARRWCGEDGECVSGVWVVRFWVVDM